MLKTDWGLGEEQGIYFYQVVPEIIRWALIGQRRNIQ
jgi:hypothetical protein